MSSGAGLRGNADPALLWLWCRPAAVALIQLLAWELTYATGVTVKSKKQTNKQTNKQKKPKTQTFLQRRQTDGQNAHEKVFNITNDQITKLQ